MADFRLGEDSPRELARGAAEAQQMCRAFDHSSLGVLVLVRSGELIACNHSARELGFRGGNVDSLLQRDQGRWLREAIGRCCRSQRVEVLRVAQLGAVQAAFELELSPWSLCPDRVLMLVRKRVEGESPSPAIEQQRNRFEVLGRLAAGFAHDFNNLLTGLRGSLTLARLAGTDQRRSQALVAAESATLRAGEIVRQLSVLSTPEKPEPGAHVADVVSEVAQLVACMAGGDRVHFYVVPDVGRVSLPSSDLHQALLNLVMNARSAIRSRGSHGRIDITAVISRRCAPTTRQALDWVWIRASDNGTGIPSNFKQWIFEPYYTRGNGQTGTGLGLFHVKWAVEQAGGWVEVESEEGNGSVFHLFLPTDAWSRQGKPRSDGGGERSMITETRAENREAVVMPHIVICDDETRLAALTAGLLSDLGFSTQAVSLGSEAVQAVVELGAPCVLVLDVNLRGSASAHSVLDTLSGAPVAAVLISGLGEEEVPRDVRHHPLVTSFLSKPYSVEEMVASLRRAQSRIATPSANLT